MHWGYKPYYDLGKITEKMLREVKKNVWFLEESEDEYTSMWDVCVCVLWVCVCVCVSVCMYVWI